MTIRVYKLDDQLERRKSYATISRVTKLEESDNTLFVHTYFSDNCGDPIQQFNLDEVGIDVFVGRY